MHRINNYNDAHPLAHLILRPRRGPSPSERSIWTRAKLQERGSKKYAPSKAIFSRRRCPTVEAEVPPGEPRRPGRVSHEQSGQSNMNLTRVETHEAKECKTVVFKPIVLATPLSKLRKRNANPTHLDGPMRYFANSFANRGLWTQLGPITRKRVIFFGESAKQAHKGETLNRQN